MIYLLRSFGRRGRSFLKIGFTDDITQRMSQYFYSNPGNEVISTREGDEFTEDLIQIYLKYLGFQYKKHGKLEEWFIDSPEVYQIFHISVDKLKTIIWKHRNSIFSGDLLKTTTYFKVFEALFHENEEGFVGEEFIIISPSKVKWSGAKSVDILFWKLFKRKNSNQESTLKECTTEEDKIVQDFLDSKFYSTGIFEKKMKMYCEFMDSIKGNREIEDIIYYKIKDDRFRKYYNFYGTSGCSSRKYQEKNLYDGMLDSTKEEEVLRAINNYFKYGSSYTLKEIKSSLDVIYRNLGITKTPKATDLGRYFSLVRVKFTDPQTKKRIEGFKLGPL